jgi:hypothetical protein
MTGDEIKAIRYSMHKTSVEFGRLLGWTGNYRTIKKMIDRLETGAVIPDARLAAKIRAVARKHRARQNGGY